MRRGGTDRGVALINALVMLAAISAVATALMFLAERSRGRLQNLQEVAQATLYLDSVAHLVPMILEKDWKDTDKLDHLGEIWAKPEYALPIDRGLVEGSLHDLQGRFNINWLTDRGAPDMTQVLERLLRRLELPPVLASAIAEYVSETGPANPSLYTNRAIAMQPPKGRLYSIDELRLVYGMTPGHFRRLAPFVASLPANSQLNVNTAPVELLEAFLPAANPTALSRLTEARAQEPFQSVGDFADQARRLIHRDVFQGATTGRFSVNSNWFQAMFTASLGRIKLSRRLIVHRSDQDGHVSIQENQ